MYANDGVLYFAKRIIFGTHYCDINCPFIMKKFCSHYDMVMEAHCIQIKDVVIKCPTAFYIKSAAHRINVLLEFQKLFSMTLLTMNTNLILRNCLTAKTLVHATEGSVG